MKKFELELLVVSNDFLDAHHFLLILRHPDLHNMDIRPGQFV